MKPIGWLVILSLTVIACQSNYTLMDQILSTLDAEFNEILSNKDKYELQVRYTQIDRNKDGIPSLKSYDYNVDTSRYFYPASTVKMPVAFLALQRLKEMGIGRDVSMHTDSIRPPQSPQLVDSTSSTGFPNVGHYIKKIFSVSDNNAYNRLYELLGQDYINTQLKEKGIFNNSRIVTRVGISGFTTDDNKYTNPVSFVDEEGQEMYAQEEKLATGDYFETLDDVIKGKGYYSDDLDSIIMEPFDMSKKNFMSIPDLEASMIRIILPELYSESERFDLGEDDYKFLWETMQKTPREYPHLQDHLDTYYDSYVKFFLFGNSESPMPEHIRIFNKVGFAYGYLTDCAYIIDTEANIEFFLTATIHVNENKIYNDGKYEYEKGIDFLAQLGRQVYEYDKKRERTAAPQLSKYIFNN